ncbi:MAG: hypothetical protein ACI814_001997, partial [Mariniblastus sp.]
SRLINPDRLNAQPPETVRCEIHHAQRTSFLPEKLDKRELTLQVTIRSIRPFLAYAY